MAEQLEFFEKEELLHFLRVNKTEISLLEQPQIFLNQLRDHNIIPRDRYERISRMRKKERVQKNLYDLLSWVEVKQKEHIVLFWKCAFSHTILNQYPRLQMLQKSLMDGSFRNIQLPKKSENATTDQEKSQKSSEGEEQRGKKMVKSVKKKRKQSAESAEDEEQPGPSCPQMPAQGKRKIRYSSPLKKGEKSNIWEWPIYKSSLPVTCGCQKGTLNRDRLAKGEKCIMVDKKWFSPPEFERLGGRGNYKNWKLSIRCSNAPLKKLFEEGHLKSKPYKGGHQKGHKALVATDDFHTDSEDDDMDTDQNDESGSSSASTVADEEVGGQSAPQPQVSPSDDNTEVFKVTCGRLEGNLHLKRFASGDRGKSIRTAESWLTPMEFLKMALGPTDASWRKEIKWDGGPLSTLPKLHSLLCPCPLCDPNSEDLENQNNDDECYICQSEERLLVQCDMCPLSFHQSCHLPHVTNAQCGKKSKWVCTFCVYRISQEYYTRKELTRDAAMSSDMSQHAMECHYLLMHLRRADRQQMFAVNPCLNLPDYSTVINTPVWLGSIADRLQESHYKTVGEFVSDVQRIFANSTTYNRDNTELINETQRLHELFDEDFSSVFKISS